MASENFVIPAVGELAGIQSEGSTAELRDALKQSGPFFLDGIMRQAFTMCWLMLPEKKRSAATVVNTLRGIFERTARAFEEDAKAFDP